MKLVVYSRYFAPSIGGVESSVLLLARGLAARRAASGEPEFAVTLVTQTPAGGMDDAAFPFGIVRQPGFAQLWRLMRGAAVVHLAGPPLLPLAMGWVLRKPVVVEHHGYQAICPNGLLLIEPQLSVCPGQFQAGRYGKCARCNPTGILGWKSVKGVALTFLRRWFCRRVAANLTITEHVRKRHGLPRSATLYYGIEDPLAGQTSHAISAPTSDRMHFAFVGRFVPEKGLSVLVQAASILCKEGRSFTLSLIGDGPERARLEEQIRSEALGDRARITGFLSGQALQDALGSVDAVVMPSIWEETAGLAAIEQMMRGKLVIASAIGGLGEVLGDTGLTCLPGDAKSLAAALRTVLDQPAMLREMGAQARARALQWFSRSRTIEEHAIVYRKLAAR